MKLTPLPRPQPPSLDISNDPTIDRELKKCLLHELWSRPGSRVVKRNGALLVRDGRFEYLAERLCEARRR